MPTASRLYERFIDPGTDPLWLRIVFFCLCIGTVVAYAADAWIHRRWMPWKVGNFFLHPQRPSEKNYDIEKTKYRRVVREL